MFRFRLLKGFQEAELTLFNATRDPCDIQLEASLAILQPHHGTTIYGAWQVGSQKRTTRRQNSPGVPIMPAAPSGLVLEE